MIPLSIPLEAWLLIAAFALSNIAAFSGAGTLLACPAALRATVWSQARAAPKPEVQAKACAKVLR